MSASSQSNDSSCSSRCESDYRSCVAGKEHDSVCRMKRAQCSCGCTAA